MRDKKGDSKNKASEGCDLEKELSTLVYKKVIPSKIAEKLEKKLKEKNVKLSKEQLHALVYKIREVINDIRSGKTPVSGGVDTDTQGLIETIERLEGRISSIESGRPSKTKGFTTNDIHIPGKTRSTNYEWDMDPLMDIPNDPESIIILMKWLQYLVDKCGHSHLSDILDYYVDIEWISDDAKISLLDYSQGITEGYSKSGTEDGEKEREKGKTFSDLPAKDHIQSLLFIQKLKGTHLDKHFLDRIDGELTRIAKKLDNYKFK